MKKRWSTAKILIVYLISLILVLALITGVFWIWLEKGGSKLDKPAAMGNRILRAALGGEDNRRSGSGSDGKDRGRRADAENEEENRPETDPETDRVQIGSQDRIVRDQLVTPVGGGQDTVTVMVYLNGSNLESDSGFATGDVEEMLKATSSDQVNVVIETLGTKRWQRFDISSDHTQRWHIEDHKLVLVDNTLKQLDCTDPQTLTDFIRWSAENYPADRYFLILWDHGGGSVEGYGYDQWQDYNASLTMDEIYSALEQSGIVFDFIGFDACIMSSVEICYALYPFCDYCILSEDFESAIGWSYTGWLTKLASNTSIDTPSLAKILIDDMVTANIKDADGCDSTLALIDERYIPSVFSSWMDFAFANEETLLATNYSREVERTGRARPLEEDFINLSDTDDLTDEDRVSSDLVGYYITDALALVVSVDSPYSKPLVAKLARAVAYYNCTDDNIGMTGLSVTLPYQDLNFYKNLGVVYSGIGIEKRYIEWLAKFQEAYTPAEFYDYEEFDQQWNGWEEYNSN